MSETAVDGRPATATLMIHCPVCGSDGGETLGVTGAVDPALQSAVVMACERCDTVYLSPPPERSASVDADAETDSVYARSIRRLKQGMPANSRVFCAGADPRSLLSRDPGAGRFDRILLPLALESADDPAVMLAHAVSLLEAGGQADVLVGNASSTCFRLFGGRHWYGYRYPRVRQCFRAEGIRVLAARQGLGVSGTRTLFAPGAWLASARNWLRDWGAGRFLTALLTGPWGVPWLVASLIESVALLRGRGSVLVVHLQKEATP